MNLNEIGVLKWKRRLTTWGWQSLHCISRSYKAGTLSLFFSINIYTESIKKKRSGMAP